MNALAGVSGGAFQAAFGDSELHGAVADRGVVDHPAKGRGPGAWRAEAIGFTHESAIEIQPGVGLSVAGLLGALGKPVVRGLDQKDVDPAVVVASGHEHGIEEGAASDVRLRPLESKAGAIGSAKGAG